MRRNRVRDALLGSCFAIALSTALVAPAAASPVRIRENGSVSKSETSPVDATQISFIARRSFDLPIVPGQPFYLSLLRWVPAGPMHLAELVGEDEVFLGAPTWQFGGAVNGVQSYVADWLVTDPTAGSHTYLAIFEATDTFDSLTLRVDVEVAPVSMSVTVTAAQNPVQAHHSIVLSPALEGPGTGIERTGDFEWRNADSGALLATRPAVDPSLTLSALPVGIHHFTVTYTGDEVHSSAVSPVFALTVVPDAVDATSVGLQYGTFYPVTDGYRDTDAIKGYRAERISVAIRIYSPSGSIVRSATVAAGTGAYSYTWNGRNTSGTILAAGKYKVLQTLTDAFGNKKAYTSYVTLSKKRLVTYTKNVTKLGSAVTAKGSAGTGSVGLFSAGYAKVTAGSGWALAGWELLIPAAVVYKSVSFQVYAKGPLTAPANQMAIQNFTTCPRVAGPWDEGCFARWRTVGNGSNTVAWYSTSGTGLSAYRSGRYVRGLVDVSFGTVYVYKAQAKVVYQVLQ